MADQYSNQNNPDQSSTQDQYGNKNLGTNIGTGDYAHQGAGTDLGTDQYTNSGRDTGEGAGTDTATDLDADQYTSWNKGTYQYPRTGADPETGGAGPDPYTPPNTPIVSGGEGLYGDEDEPRSEQNRDRHGNPYQYGSQGGPVPPGSSQDQYGTRGSQDQYGNQQ
ncbi:MAG TPA: hypothetical protein VFA10_10255 [Ktedonobacteraceae bacterium]|jgi:hypothetical protein|nr:hypothetical protein [Ktedonobacteraceae bacterium]